MNLLSAIFDLLSPARCEMCGGRLVHGEEMLCLFCKESLVRRDDVLSPTDNETVRLLSLIHI